MADHCLVVAAVIIGFTIITEMMLACYKFSNQECLLEVQLSDIVLTDSDAHPATQMVDEECQQFRRLVIWLFW